MFGAACIYYVYSKHVGTTVVLQRGCYVEKAKAPENRPFHRRYNKSFANYLGVDAKWNFDEIRPEKPGLESDWSGGSFPVIALDR